MSLVRHICDAKGCNREFADERGLGIHRSSHQREKVTCPKCGRQVAYLDTHLRKAHAENTQQLLESLVSVFEELEKLRAENDELRKALAKST